MNPNYSLVTLPRQQIRPERGDQVQRDRDQLSRQNYQILPDKTKLDATKQVGVFLLKHALICFQKMPTLIMRSFSKL